MNRKTTTNAVVAGLAAVLLVTSGCRLPRGHREGYLVLGLRTGYQMQIYQVEKDLLADRIGVKPADRLIGINGKPVNSEEDVRVVRESLAVGDRVEFTVVTQKDEKATTVTRKGAVTEADIGSSSNYLVYGYEKVGEKTLRRWLHLGVIAFGDWTGTMRERGVQSIGLHVDVLPERVARVTAIVACILPKAFLFGIDPSDGIAAMAHVTFPTLFLGRSNEGLVANLLLFTGMHTPEGPMWSLWPAAGLALQKGGSGVAYITPFNSAGWGDESLSGVTLGGVVKVGSQCVACLPLFSFVDPKG